MTVFRWPNGSKTIPRVTSEWNPARKNPVTGIIQPHNGIDVIGFPLNLSCADGVVTFARYNGGAGNEVRVRHDDGSESRYKHNARFLVRVGQRVTVGTALGVMGTTGQSTGIHLHFETRLSPTSAPMNPRTFMVVRIEPASSFTPSREEIAVKVIVRVNSGTEEWSLIHPALDGGDDLQKGYIVTNDPARALIWERNYASGGGSADTLGVTRASGKSNRDAYMSHQAEARKVREAYLRGTGVTGEGGVSEEAIARLVTEGVNAALASFKLNVEITGQNAA